MQFLWVPLQAAPLQSATFLPTSQSPHLPNFRSEPAYLYCFNNYCSQFQTLSQTLTQQLPINNGLIHLIENPSLDTTDAQETTASDSEACLLASNKINPSPSGLEVEIEGIKNKITKKTIDNDPHSDQASYIPEEQPQRGGVYSLGKQSKNIPKNYGKAILIFIQKNQPYVQRVLSHLEINSRDFMRSVNGAKRNLKSILQLKSLWLEENPFSKAYRIISLEYLRRHSLEYIFNSRVENFSNHVKYRYRIIESVGDPRNFTVMKEF